MSIEEAEKLIQKSYVESKNRAGLKVIKDDLSGKGSEISHVLHKKADKDNRLTL